MWRHAVRTIGIAVAVAATAAAGCAGDLTPVRRPFTVRRAVPADAKIVISLETSDCSTNHVRVEETETVVFVSAYYTKPQRAECPGTERTEERVVELDRPLGSRTVVDGIPPESTRPPDRGTGPNG